MADIETEYKETRDIPFDGVMALYKANKWSCAEKPDELYQSLMSSHSLVSAWDQDKLVGLGNAISDGFLVVYYPHLLVLPEYQGRGIGSGIMKVLISKYKDFHQQVLFAVPEAIEFYNTTYAVA